MPEKKDSKDNTHFTDWMGKKIVYFLAMEKYMSSRISTESLSNQSYENFIHLSRMTEKTSH